MEFEVDQLGLNNFHVTLLQRGDQTLIFSAVDLYYNINEKFELIGTATSDGINGVTIELNPIGLLFHPSIYDWRGEEYTGDIIQIQGKPAFGQTHTDREDIGIWIDGQIAKWVKDQFN